MSVVRVVTILVVCLSVSTVASESPVRLDWDAAARILPDAVLTAWRSPVPVDEGAQRQHLDLAGFWAFAPAASDGAAPAEVSGYGLMQVPGSWSPPDLWSWRPPQGWQHSDGNPFVMRPGTGPHWESFDPFACTRAWYARLVTVPETWRGRRVFLDLERVATDARLFVDGAPVAGTLAWPDGRFELTQVLDDGETHCLHLLVAVGDETRRELLLMGTDAGVEVESKLHHRGLLGPVRLVSEPAAPLIADGLRIEPRVAAGTLDLVVPVTAETGAHLRWEVAIRRHDDGSLALRAADQATVADDGHLHLSLAWADADTWTPANPCLHDLELTLHGAQGASDSTARRFGFREIDIRGRELLLNGGPLRLRPVMSHHVPMGGLTLQSGVPITRELIRKHFRYLREMGFNLQEYWPRDPLARGTPLPMDAWAEVADEEGFLLTGPMPHLRHHLDAWRHDRPEGWDWPQWAVDAGALRLQQAGATSSVWIRAKSHTAAVTIQRVVELPADARRLELRARMRADVSEPGREAWNGARIELQLLGADGKRLGKVSGEPHLADSSDWIEREVVVELPPAAHRIRLVAGMWHAIGEAEFADLQLVVDGRELPIGGDFTAAGTAEAHQRLRREAASLVDPLAHHPSILMWGTSGNLFGSSLSPWTIGDRAAGLERHPSWARSRLQPGLAAMEALRGCDPTRPVFTHSGGAVGDVYSANFYHAWTPLQDKTEWLTRYLAAGDMPFWIVEYGNPINLSWRRDRAGHTSADTSEPWLTEYAAMELGFAAYALETPAYRSALATSYRGTVDGKTRRWHFRQPHLEEEPAFQQITAEHYRAVWRAWRAQGAGFLPTPWQYGHALQTPLFEPGLDVAGVVPAAPAALSPEIAALDPYAPEFGVRELPLAAVLRAESAPCIAYLAGADADPSPGEPSGREVFTAQTRNYRTGEPFERSVVVVNDAPHPVRYDLALELQVDGRQPQRQVVQGEVAPGTVLRRPVALAAPELAAQQRAAGELRLSGSLAEHTIDERVTLGFFGPAEPGLPTVTVHDPRGASVALLHDLGYQVVEWSGGPVESLIVGRNALADEPQLLAQLEPAIRGGAAVLLLEQHPDVLRDLLGFRVAGRIERRAWPVRSNAGLLDGLGADDLRDWAGESALLEPYPRHYDNRSPQVANGGWRWGGRGGVTSAAVEKPHYSAWRPILQTGFDLAYSPLLELPVGAGRLVLCTLDLHDHARQDPAAERVLHQLIAALAHKDAGFAPERPAHLVADDTWAPLLDEAGIATTPGLDALAPEAVVLIGRALDATQRAAIDQHVAAGGRALVLPGTPIPPGWGLERQAVEVQAGSIAPPRLAALRGLDASELRIRAAHPGTVLVGEGAIDAEGQYAEREIGQGLVAVVDVDPWRFDTAAHPYLRFTVWRQARAFAQVLANHGLRSRHDHRIFVPPAAATRIPLAGTWRAHPTALVPAGGRALTETGVSAKAQAIISAEDAATEAIEVELPAEWERFGGRWREADGEAVFVREVDIPPEWSGQDLLLSLGVLDDFDRVYVDGVAIGSTAADTPRWWTVPRRYRVPGDRVRPGRMRIAVRIFDHQGGGGFTSRDPAELFLMPLAAHAEQQARSSERGPYHHDYIDDFATGDDPYRYYNW